MATSNTPYQHAPADIALWERLLWASWPDNRPRPTEAQFQQANERYHIDCNAMVERGYTGDGLCGLKFVMMTFTRPCWWHYFFPEEKLNFDFPVVVLKIED